MKGLYCHNYFHFCPFYLRIFLSFRYAFGKLHCGCEILYFHAISEIISLDLPQTLAGKAQHGAAMRY